MRGIFTGKSIRAADGAALALIGVAFVLWGHFASQAVLKPEMHADERGWTASALYYCGLYDARELHREQWDGVELGTFGDLNLHVGEVMIGLPAYRFAKREELTYAPQYKPELQDNMGLCSARVPAPPVRLLRLARHTAMFWAFMASATMIVAAWWMGGAAVAVVFSYTILPNRFFIEYSAYVLTDMPYLFFLGMGALCGIWLLRSRVPWQRTAAVACAGAMGGLAASVKVTGVLLISLYVFVLIVLLLRMGSVSRWGAIARLALCGVVSLVPVYALNPAFWPDFSRVDLKAAQAEYAGLSKGEIELGDHPDRGALWASLTEIDLRASKFRTACPQLANLMRPLEFPLLFPRWNALFQSLSTQYPVKDPLEAAKGALFRYATSLFEVAFLFYGLYAALGVVKRGLRESPRPAMLAGLCYLGVLFVFLAIMLPVAGFERYYLPVILISRVYVAVGVVAALEHPRQLIAELLAKRQSGSMETSAL